MVNIFFFRTLFRSYYYLMRKTLEEYFLFENFVMQKNINTSHLPKSSIFVG